MKNISARQIKILALIMAVMICISFFTYTLSLVVGYSSGVNEQAVERAEFYAKEQASYIEKQADLLKGETEYLASRLSKCKTLEQFRQQIKDYCAAEDSDEALVEILYFKDDLLMHWNGEESEQYPQIYAIKDREHTELSTVFQYDNRTMAMAVSATVDSPFADQIVMVFDKGVIALSEYAYEDDDQIPCVQKAEFVLLCRHDGRLIDRIENADGYDIGNLPVQEGLIQSLFDDSGVAKKAGDALFNGGLESFAFQKGAQDCILSIYSFGVSEGSLALVCAYQVSNVYGEGLAVIRNITAALLGLAITMAILIGAIVVTGVMARRRIYQLEMVDPYLNCATEKKFSKKAEEILKLHSSSGFAFVSLNINNFKYVTEHFGDYAGKKLSAFGAEVIYGALRVEETFGYAGDGEFLILMHCQERRAFTERLNGLYLRLSSFNDFADSNYKVSVAFAVYEVEREEKQKVQNMLDKLQMAKDAATVQSAFFSVSFYEDIMHENYIKKAEIEGKMEQALQNSEFHLFYQPKYNLKAKNMDGCEILIRWYDPALGKYHVPGEFLPVFEENHFIVKLDHFVFFKACENMAKRIENRQICYPVSVNVSRVTAIQPDFLDYYIRIKNKFQIKDNFITLEFTESFAYENYEFLSKIVEKLHENGLQCSIDDFGTGYSSYNILKSIPMDEIKLDKFFLDKGVSPERDQTLLKSVIDMVKKLGMKVTQEGVETKEDLYRLEELGCDVIQGYYFAKPMKYTDYCQFIDQNFV